MTLIAIVIFAVWIILDIGAMLFGSDSAGLLLILVISIPYLIHEFRELRDICKGEKTHDE